MAEIHEFPNDGQRFWVALEPRVRAWLLALESPKIADQVLAKLAPAARRVGAVAYGRTVIPLNADGPEALNQYIGNLVHGMLEELAIREIALCTVYEDLNAEVAAARKAYWESFT